MLTVTTADGLTPHGASIPAKTGKPTLLVFHGNASSARVRSNGSPRSRRAPLAARSYGIVAAEYRGYAGNPDQPGEAGLMADAEAFYAAARAQAGGAPVYVVGHSLGSGVAFGLARQTPAGRAGHDRHV